ncbi:MAG: hypothetical protein Q9195_002074 [Heterodermia aff. obscurata]
MESFFTSIHTLGSQYNCQHWAVSTGIKIRTERATFTEDLKSVWIALRYRHPILATQFEEGKLVYNTADEIELKQWLNETFIVHPSNMTGSELYGTTPRPLKRVICNILPHTQEIVIQAMHAHLDGLGSVTLFDNLLSMLNKPQQAPIFGDEAKNLLAPFASLARIPAPTPKQQARWDRSLNTWLNAHPTLRLAATNTEDIPGRSRMHSLTFTEASTARIVGASRELGLTVTHTAQAAIALASRIHGGNTEHNTFPTFAIYNAREYCTDSCPDASALVGPHVMASPVTLKLDSFLTTAYGVRDAFVSNRADKYALTMAPTFFTTIPQILATPPPIPAAEPLLSSFGNLDGRLRRSYGADETDGKKGIHVDDFWCTLDEATPDIYVGLWTFRGRLRLQIGYNERYHERGSVERWLGLVRGELEAGLAVKLEVEEE